MLFDKTSCELTLCGQPLVALSNKIVRVHLFIHVNENPDMPALECRLWYAKPFAFALHLHTAKYDCESGRIITDIKFSNLKQAESAVDDAMRDIVSRYEETEIDDLFYLSPPDFANKIRFE